MTQNITADISKRFEDSPSHQRQPSLWCGLFSRADMNVEVHACFYQNIISVSMTGSKNPEPAGDVASCPWWATTFANPNVANFSRFFIELVTVIVHSCLLISHKWIISSKTYTNKELVTKTISYMLKRKTAIWMSSLRAIAKKWSF